MENNNDASKARVLLVEDNAQDAELAMHALKEHNLADDVTWVKDGAQALDFVFAQGVYAGRSLSSQPKIIMLDLKMPKISGLEVLAKIKADERTRNIPVLILTSSQEDSDLKKAYDLGANSYVVKPVDFNNFSRSVADAGLYWLILNKTTS
jgi:CheY-like chemotaxis protein